jgi:uncharacterized protein (TIGR02118 family)
MIKAIVLYPTPTDTSEFERRYRDEHAPLTKNDLEGLRQFRAAKVVGSPTGPAPYAYVAELTFDSPAALEAAFSSERGQGVVAHAFEISTGGPLTVLVTADLD